MKTDYTLFRNARLIACFASAIYLVNYIFSLFRGPILSGESAGLMLGDYSFNWILLAPAYLCLLADMLLATFAGRMMREAFPKQSKTLVSAIVSVAVCAALLFAAGAGLKPMTFYGGALFCGAALGYLVNIGEVDSRRGREAAVTAILCSVMFLGLAALPRHRFLMLPAMLTFAYYSMVWLSSGAAQKLASKRWIKPAAVVLCTAAFIIAIIGLFASFGFLSMTSLAPAWRLLLLFVLLIVLFLRIKE